MTISFDLLLESERGAKPEYDVAKLCGIRLAVAAESKSGRKFSADLVKQLTGGDRIRGREIKQSSIEFLPTHKLWLYTNHAPMLADGGDEATWNRLRRVPFNNQVPRSERDPRILAALENPESPTARAFLAWAVRGALAWQAQGLGTSRAVEASTAAYQEETDPLADFIEDRCIVEPAASVSAAALRQAYDEWARTNGIRFTLSKRNLASCIRKHGAVEHRGTGGIRGWKGIGVTIVT